jgi:hypothetical protein
MPIAPLREGRSQLSFAIIFGEDNFEIRVRRGVLGHTENLESAGIRSAEVEGEARRVKRAKVKRAKVKRAKVKRAEG